MFDKQQASHTLGLEQDGSLIKGIALSLVKGNPKVDSTLTVALSADRNVKPLDMIAHGSKYLVVTSINGQDTLIRSLDVKIKKEKDIDAALSFQAEPLLPYPIENAILDRVIISQEKEGSQLSLIAVRKDHLKNHIDWWNNLSVEPEVISVAPHSLTLFANYATAAIAPYYAIHIGIETTLCVLINDNKIIASQTISGGIRPIIDHIFPDNDLLQETPQQLATLSLSEFELESSSSVKASIDNLKLSITRMIYSLAKQTKWKEISHVLITGPGALIGGFPEMIERALEKTPLVIAVPPSLNIALEELHFFALPFGAALSALPKKFDQINLRQQEFAYPSPWKRLKAPLSLYFLLCIGLSLAIILFGQAYIHYREAEIKQEYLDLLNFMGKPYHQFEQQLAPHDALRDEDVPTPASLTMSAIQHRLQRLEKEIKSTPQIYPLKPNVPLVSDVLAWLSTHTNFVGGEEAGSLKIENFSYMMVKRPDPTKKQEKYQVKVELEFSSPTPKMAREFHDALIAPNELVDPKAEIKWSSNRDRYRTSFYLKDRTQYPGL